MFYIFYDRFLDVSWKFYGFTRGEACVLGMENFSVTRTFGAFWLYGGRIVGVFLEVRCMILSLIVTYLTVSTLGRWVTS